MDTVESLAELVGEFDRNYSEICEENRAHYNAYFGQVGKSLLLSVVSRSQVSAWTAAHGRATHSPKMEIPKLNQMLLLAPQVRDFQNNFFGALSATGVSMFEKYSSENGDLDSLPEGARLLLGDKDTLVTALQVSIGMTVGMMQEGDGWGCQMITSGANKVLQRRRPTS